MIDHNINAINISDSENAVWYKFFGNRDEFNKSIMAFKPRITNSWSMKLYTEYVKTFVITDIVNLDDWCNEKAVYADYKKNLSKIYRAFPESMVDNMELIHYQKFCSDVNDFYLQIRNDLCDFGVPEIQSYVGAWNTMYWSLRTFRSHYYNTFYTLESEESKDLYQKSPLRCMLLFLINKRLDRLIPEGETFKFGSVYFQAMPYLDEVSKHINNFLKEEYASDMLVCKLIS